MIAQNYPKAENSIKLYIEEYLVRESKGYTYIIYLQVILCQIGGELKVISGCVTHYNVGKRVDCLSFLMISVKTLIEYNYWIKLGMLVVM